MDAHELNTWLILGTLFLLCLVGLGIGIYDTIKQKKEKSLSAYDVFSQVTELLQVNSTRPERAEAPSPGHRPGYNGNRQDAL